MFANFQKDPFQTNEVRNNVLTTWHLKYHGIIVHIPMYFGWYTPVQVVHVLNKQQETKPNTV